ncbi:hypothetical protein LXL04_033624 [Taraxacum kok-saghyz]
MSMLPSKSLLRFQAVCKSWHSLISSPEFIATHLHNFNQQNSRNIVRCCLWTEKKEVYTIHLDDQHLTLDFPIDFPFNLHRDEYGTIFFTLIGFCNGVICLYNERSTTYEIMLWNPSIRNKLTLTPPYYKPELSLVFGFGYYKTSNDYKVVRLAYDRSDMNGRPEAEIYTVKTAIWQAVGFPQDIPCYHILSDYSQVFFNGCIHWLAADLGVSNCSMLTFDMNTNLFGEIQLPKSLVLYSSMGVTLMVVGEYVGVIYSSRPSAVGSSTYKIWVMKEYKKPTSWTMIYDVNYPDTDLGRPLKLRDNGDLVTESRRCNLMICNEKVGCYTVGGCCSKGVKLWSISIDKYHESLALLDVGNNGLVEE